MRTLPRFAFTARTLATLPLAVAIGLSAPVAAETLSAPHGKKLGTGRAPVFFYADEVQRDEENGLTVAKGHVQITQGNLTVLADTVTYNEVAETITASGHVSLTRPSGDVISGSYVELTDNLQEGFVENVRVLMLDNSRAAANTARRTGGSRLEMRRGVYSPCDLCADDPTAPPIWQIKAEKIVHDEKTHLIEYHDATLEIAGLPLLYAPYISIPDPTVKRASGFLPPSGGSSRNLGAYVRIPYYWVLGPDRDLTLTPIITGVAGQVMSGEYRQRFATANLELRGSINDGNFSTSDSKSRSNGALRGHIFGTGRFDLDEIWRLGADVARATDQTYLQRFGFGSTPSFLDNRAYAEGFYPRSFASINAYAFQPLRQGLSDRSQPIVLPVADFNWITPTDDWGGHWNLDANFLNISYLTGAGSHRLSLGGAWTREATGPLGEVYTVYASLRGDGYYANDLARLPGPLQNGTFQSVFAGQTGSSINGRVFPQIAVKWRYPWVRRGENFQQIVEPIAMLVAAPVGGNPLRLPNQDSLIFEYSDADLFVPDRFPGYDRVDGGQRFDYGLQASIYGAHGGRSQFLVGQSYRLERNGSFPAVSGLGDRRSDIVGRLVVSPSDSLDLAYRFRLDRSDLRVQRQEASISGGGDQARLGLSIVDLPPDPLPVNPKDRSRRDQIGFNANLGLTRYWSMNFGTIRNLEGDLGTVSTRAVLTYHDECFALVTALGQSGVSNRDIRPGTSLLFTLILKNFGAINAPSITTTAGGLP